MPQKTWLQTADMKTQEKMEKKKGKGEEREIIGLSAEDEGIRSREIRTWLSTVAKPAKPQPVPPYSLPLSTHPHGIRNNVTDRSIRNNSFEDP